MRQKAEAFNGQSNDQSSESHQNGSVNQKPKYDIEGEYIKFEEVKE